MLSLKYYFGSRSVYVAQAQVIPTLTLVIGTINGTTVARSVHPPFSFKLGRQTWEPQVGTEVSDSPQFLSPKSRFRIGRWLSSMWPSYSVISTVKTKTSRPKEGSNTAIAHPSKSPLIFPPLTLHIKLKI